MSAAAAPTPPPVHIRAPTVADMPALRGIIDAVDLFPSSMLDDMIAPFLNKQQDAPAAAASAAPAASPDVWWVCCSAADSVQALAFASPEKLTSGTFNLLLLAVHPASQSRGLGSALMAHVENALRDASQRLLLVETSGADEYARARSFYTQRGFTLEARIREFYSAGEDKLVYWKKLQA